MLRQAYSGKPRRVLHRLLWFGLALGLVGCDVPRDTETNTTKFSVTIQEINENNVLVSDVLTKGVTKDDYVKVQFVSILTTINGSTFYDPYLVGAPGSFDFIVLNTYTVVYHRSDGGSEPVPFTSKCNVVLKPPISTSPSATTTETTVQIVAVLALQKNQTPLQELQNSGQIYTSAEITFYGEDGYGNELAVSGFLPISFGNFADS